MPVVSCWSVGGCDWPLKVPFISGGRLFGILEISAWPSPLLTDQDVLGCGRFRGAVLGHWLRSPLDDGAVPLDCELVVATVVVEDVEEVDEMDEEELDRWRALRVNIARTSSLVGFNGCPPLPLHVGLLSGNEGGFATAVIRKGLWLRYVVDGC
jgi:hypothetical protein